MCTVSADELTTVYLKPSDNWKSAGARFALYMFKDAEGDDPKIEGWVDFTEIGNGLYYAYFNKKYAKMIFCRMNGSTTENNWDNKWTQTDDLDAPATSAPVYTIDGWNTTPTTSSIESSGCTIHKIYVQDKEATGQIPHFYEYQDGTWYSIDNAWPGAALTTETVEGQTWYVFKTLKTSVLGRFMQAWNNDSNFAAGGIQFDLSSGDLQYNYYPSAYQSILTSDALSAPATAYFRANNGASELKYYFWNNDGINSEGFTTTTVGGVDWLTIKTYKPSFSIQFYTYNNDGGNDKTWDDYSSQYTFSAGDEDYYYAFLGLPVLKLESKYYVVYSNGWNIDPTKHIDNDDSKDLENVRVVELNAGENFEFKGTLENTNYEWVNYVIVPASKCDGSKIVAENWDEILSPGSKSTDAYGISAFEAHTFNTELRTWKRWQIQGVNSKFDISFNFATMTWNSNPYKEVEVTSAGYATFSKTGAAQVPDGVNAYIITTVGENTVQLSPLEDNAVIPSGAGVILSADADTYKMYAVTSGTETTSVTGNKLVGTADSAADLTEVSNAYIFADGAKGVGFYPLNTSAGAWISANKAYLQLEEGEAREFFGFDDQSTGINELNEQTNTFDGAIYNLQGVRLSKFQKGLNIVNGKKFLVK